MRDSFAGFAAREFEGLPAFWRPDDRFKTCRVVLHARRPLDDSAAARALLPGLMLHGTADAPSRPALARRMEELYGAGVGPSTTKVGELHEFRLSLDLVAGRFLPDHPDQLALGAEFVGSYVSRPLLDGAGFPVEAFERERRHTLDAVRAMIDDRASWATQQAIQQACIGEAAAIPEYGGLDELEALEREDPERARQDFLGRGDMWLVASGAFDDAEAERAFETVVRTLPPRQPVPCEPSQPIARRDVRRVTERVPLQQSRLIMVLRFDALDVAPNEWVARRLLISMFGGGPHSRLFREVREERSLAYSASASLDRGTGIVLVSVGLDESAADEAEREIRRQLELLSSGQFTDEELDTARAQFLSAIASVNDSVATACQFVSDQWSLGLDATPADLAQRYAQRTRDEVVAAAAGLWLDFVYLLAPEVDA